MSDFKNRSFVDQYLSRTYDSKEVAENLREKFFNALENRNIETTIPNIIANIKSHNLSDIVLEIQSILKTEKDQTMLSYLMPNEIVDAIQNYKPRLNA